MILRRRCAGFTVVVRFVELFTAMEGSGSTTERRERSCRTLLSGNKWCLYADVPGRKHLLGRHRETRVTTMHMGVPKILPLGPRQPCEWRQSSGDVDTENTDPTNL